MDETATALKHTHRRAKPLYALSMPSRDRSAKQPGAELRVLLDTYRFAECVLFLALVITALRASLF